MTPCDEYRALLLDHQYGLLDPAEAEAVESHLAGCHDCAAARADAAKAQTLFARAARLPFPNVTFAPPAEPAAVPAPQVKPTYSRWMTWAVAAALLLAAGGLGVPAGRDWAEYAARRPRLDAAHAAAVDAAAKLEELRKADPAAAAKKERDAAEQEYDRAVAEWVRAELASPPKPASKIELTGPAAVVPGAPNEYLVRVQNAAGLAAAASVTAAVRDGAGAVLFSQTLPATPQNGARVRLPADLWAKVPPAATELTLDVTAKGDGVAAELTETIKLFAPVYRTFLTTDKPLYRPGEPVFFRSLTLDRTHLRPPTRDLSLRYEITAVANPKTLATATGRAEPIHPATGAPVLGPDGKPVRGVGCGVFRLDDKMPGGEYVLTAYEVPANHPETALRPADAVPLATRKFTVLNYTPEKLLKTLDFDARTYGPGDTVQAKLTVRDQNKPVAGAAVFTEVKGAKVQPEMAATGPDGTAMISFALPNDPDLAAVTLSVQVAAGAVSETVVRPVPVAPRSLKVEFFPEGGDLVSGVPCRVYFRATTPAGKPADLDGYLWDGSKSVAAVRTLTDPDRPGANQGTGVFAFTPEPGKRYSLRLLRPTSVLGATNPKAGAVLGGLAAAANGVYPLPRAVDNGVVLSVPDAVTNPGDPIRVRVWSRDRRVLHVGAYSRGMAVASGRVTVEPGRPAELVLTPAPGSPGGVTRVTAFEEPDPAAGGRQEFTPVAERLVYRRPAEGLKLAFAPDRKQYAPGDNVSLDLSAANEKGEPTAAILWVAVVNQSVLTMADDKAERMLPAHFLLAGEVQRPDDLEYADFFLTDHPRAAESLDLLLGTQGWRRFAEQAPGQFKATVTEEEKQRFLVSAGVRHPVAARDAVADVRFLPEYKHLSEKLAAANLVVRLATVKASEDARAAVADEAARREEFARAEAELRPVADAMAARRAWHPGLIVVGVVGVLLVLARLATGRGTPLALAGGGAAAVAVFLMSAGRSTDAALPAIPPAAVRADVIPRGADIRETPGLPPVPVKTFGPAAQPNPLPGLAEWAQRPWATNSPLDEVMPGDARSPRFGDALRRHKNLTEGGKVPTTAELNAAEKAERALTKHAPFIAREYAHTQKADADTTRTNFAETVLWHPLLVLPADGKGKVEFQLSDSVQAYRVMVAGHTTDGRLGATSGLIEVRKPLAVEFRLPAEVTAGDRIDLPVTVSNGTTNAADVKLSVWSDHLRADDADRSAVAPARGNAGLTVTLTAGPTGAAKVRVGGQAGPGLSDASERTVAVAADGFPLAGAAGGTLSKAAAATVNLPDAIVPGSLSAKLVVYTNAVAEVRAGLDGLLREPHGCFEQSSTANYPNVLILDYLKEIGKYDPKVVEDARGLLERGYARLLSFEVKKKAGEGREGFEWFGQFPPHGPLTAYGLAQFADMGRVYPVDPGLLTRTRDYLLSRRDGTGGYALPADPHGFGNAPPAVANAYITWAITEAERGTAKSEMAKELGAAAVTDDPYGLALAALAHVNRGDAGAGELLKKLAAKQMPDGSVPGATATITRSAEPDAVTETTALAALAWLRAQDRAAFAGNARAAMKWLAARRGPGGGFGATQATILVLKALIENARLNRTPAETGRVVVRVGGKVLADAPFDSAASDPVSIPLPDALKPGANAVELECTGAGSYPFAVAWAARTQEPPSDPACAIGLAVTSDAVEIQAGKLVRVTVTLTNRTAEAVAMPVAVVGLPAGLTVPPGAEQLKALAATGTVAHWELSGRELTLYWRGLPAKGTAVVPLDLTAEFPGEYRGPAGRAYLYYHPQAKTWTAPVSVRVRLPVP